MRFPVVIRFRSSQARIYAPAKSFPYYRVHWTVGGGSRRKTTKTYTEAREFAERTVRELAHGDEGSALRPKEAADTLFARQALDAFKRDTGRTVTVREAVQGYLDALRKLGTHSLAEAVARFLRSTVTVGRKDLAEAVEEFISLRAPLAEARDGKRAARSAVYIANVAAWLRKLPATFTGMPVCDLTKAHLDTYFTSPGLKALSPKSRNDRRAAFRMFFAWCVKKDWLPGDHRLLEADGLTREAVETADIDYYRPGELSAILQGASADLRPMLALCGLAGLRTEEALRLDWADVWRVAGFIEVSKTKSKGRARRLVEIAPALMAWLEPYRGMTTGPVWPGTRGRFFADFAALRDRLRIPGRENGLSGTPTPLTASPSRATRTLLPPQWVTARAWSTRTTAAWPRPTKRSSGLPCGRPKPQRTSSRSRKAQPAGDRRWTILLARLICLHPKSPPPSPSIGTAHQRNCASAKSASGDRGVSSARATLLNLSRFATPTPGA